MIGEGFSKEGGEVFQDFGRIYTSALAIHISSLIIFFLNCVRRFALVFYDSNLYLTILFGKQNNDGLIFGKFCRSIFVNYSGVSNNTNTQYNFLNLKTVPPLN